MAILTDVAPNPAAAMAVFSMFPQQAPEPEPEPEPIIPALVAAIAAPPPPRRERMEFGTVATWQKQVSPIEQPLPPAAIQVTTSIESAIVVEALSPPETKALSPPETKAPSPPETKAPVSPETAAAPPVPEIAPAEAPPIAPAAPERAEPTPAPTRFAPAEALPEPETPPSAALYRDPPPDPAAFLTPRPAAVPIAAVAAGLPPFSRPAPSRLRLWQIATGVSLCAAIAAIVVAVWPPTLRPLSIAAIGVVNAPAPLYLAEVDTAGTLRMTALATIAVPNGRDLQLWIILPGDQTPRSLGVLPARTTLFTLPSVPAEGTRFVISMEPRGGTTGGRITGQVLYGGTLANR